MWLYFRFSSERAKLNCVTHCVKFEYWYLKKLSMIRNKVVWDKHYNSNRLTERNIFLFCYSRFRLMCTFKALKWPVCDFEKQGSHLIITIKTGFCVESVNKCIYWCLSNTVVYVKDIIIRYNWTQKHPRFKKSSGNLEILTSIYCGCLGGVMQCSMSSIEVKLRHFFTKSFCYM